MLNAMDATSVTGSTGTSIKSLPLLTSVSAAGYTAFLASYAENKLGTYNSNKDKLYPLRNLDDEPIIIRKVLKVHNKDCPLSIDKVEEGINNEGWVTLRESMTCERITEDDIKKNEEKGLIGQYGVKIYGAHKRGDLLGFYSGRLVPQYIIKQPLPYSILCGDHSYVIDGDGIVSRINTIFEYDQNGRPVRQAFEGYNCDIATIEVCVNVPTKIKSGQLVTSAYLYCLYATQDIPDNSDGTELRFNYRYSEEKIDSLVQNQTIPLSSRLTSGSLGRWTFQCNLL